MTTHVMLEGGIDAPACLRSQPGDEFVSWSEAMDPQGRHFDCVECHCVLTGDRRHSRPEDDQ